jgi:hypothetical protein
MLESDMAFVESTSLSQRKTRYLRNRIERLQGYLEEGLLPPTDRALHEVAL